MFHVTRQFFTLSKESAILCKKLLAMYIQYVMKDIRNAVI